MNEKLRENNEINNKNKINRRKFIQRTTLVGAAASVAAVFPTINCNAEPVISSLSDSQSLTPKMQLNGTVSVSKPVLSPSQLSFRLGLARTRMSSYPCDSMDFIMMDIERPDNRSRHAHWCTGDLTGRLLEFLSCSEGVDGKNDPRLDTLFERILKQRQPSGAIGRYAGNDPIRIGAASKLFHGLIRYYELTNDPRALDAAEGLAEELWSVRDEWENGLKSGTVVGDIAQWVTEPFSRLYGITKDPRWMKFCEMIRDNLRSIENRTCHSHGFLSTLRGFQIMALVTGDLSWNQLPEKNRKIILDKHFDMPDGNIPEVFPKGERNEGCSIADWLMFNLNQGLIQGDDKAYEIAERTFWNALAYNQFITGGFGHRRITLNGYGVDQVSEAWWCCTQNAGMAMSDYARHTVTFRDNAIHINFLTPGKFELLVTDNRWVSVRIETSYPNRAEATVEVDRLPDEMPVKIRVPSWVRKPQIEQQRKKNSMRLTFHGEIGHRIEHRYPGIIVTYGPLLLVPAQGANSAMPSSATNSSEGVPTGYIPQALPPGIPTIKLDTPTDNEGFVKLPLCPSERPLPAWSYYDEGPGSPTWVEGAAVEVNLKYPDGKILPSRFTPMCFNTSNLSLFETPVVFHE